MQLNFSLLLLLLSFPELSPLITGGTSVFCPFLRGTLYNIPCLLCIKGIVNAFFHSLDYFFLFLSQFQTLFHFQFCHEHGRVYKADQIKFSIFFLLGGGVCAESCLLIDRRIIL